MSRQFWVEGLTWDTADATAVANTTTTTVVFSDVTVPANYMQDGRLLRYRAFGKLSTTATPTIKMGVYWGGTGGTLLAETELITNGSGVSNVNWSVELYIQTRSNGSSGSLIVFGEFKLHTSSTAVSQNVFSISGYDAPAVVSSLDLTVAKALSLAATWSAASASNTLTGMLRSIESLN